MTREKALTRAPLVIMISLFAVGAITDDSRWTYAGFSLGLISFSALIGYVAWRLRRGRQAVGQRRRS